MLQIQDTLVTLDLIEDFFVCDLDTCLGACCIEGDAGAPLTEEEYEHLCEILPEIYPMLTPAAQKVVEEQGVGYYDEEGDLVTSIVNGRDCVFTTYAPGGKCLCVLEKAWREGKIKNFKPESCYLYPVRLKEYAGFTAVNLHHWKICKCARVLGKKKGIRAYEFLKEPLIRKFGEEWYKELDTTAKEYLRQKEAGEL
ncbi:MAG: DUF3109 family protein [Bacteroidales bacterium]|nr:DUF3109 family protein [Bacteroidales bacterium]MDE7466462.1 DUF3109 family protein [Muribaculaceae bacterium]